MTWGKVSVTDNDRVESVEPNIKPLATGGTWPVGKHNLAFEARDPAGNTAWCNFTVLVLDASTADVDGFAVTPYLGLGVGLTKHAMQIANSTAPPRKQQIMGTSPASQVDSGPSAPTVPKKTTHRPVTGTMPGRNKNVGTTADTTDATGGAKEGGSRVEDGSGSTQVIVGVAVTVAVVAACILAAV